MAGAGGSSVNVSSPEQIQQAIQRGKQLAATLIRAAKTEGQTAIEIARMDTNQDGVIDRAEYIAVEGNDVDFNRYDMNGDRKLDRDEMQLLAAERLTETVQKRLEEERSARQQSQDELNLVKAQLAELQTQVAQQTPKS